MRAGRSTRGSANLRRRLEAQEESLAATDKVREGIIQNVLYQMPQEDLEFLIDATLAPRRGRKLTEREAAAKQAYAAALETESRGRRLTVRRMPEVQQLIEAAAYQVSVGR